MIIILVAKATESNVTRKDVKNYNETNLAINLVIKYVSIFIMFWWEFCLTDEKNTKKWIEVIKSIENINRYKE